MTFYINTYITRRLYQQIKDGISIIPVSTLLNFDELYSVDFSRLSEDKIFSFIDGKPTFKTTPKLMLEITIVDEAMVGYIRSYFSTEDKDPGTIQSRLTRKLKLNGLLNKPIRRGDLKVKSIGIYENGEETELNLETECEVVRLPMEVDRVEVAPFIQYLIHGSGATDTDCFILWNYLFNTVEVIQNDPDRAPIRKLDYLDSIAKLNELRKILTEYTHTLSNNVCYGFLDIITEKFPEENIYTILDHVALMMVNLKIKIEDTTWQK